MSAIIIPPIISVAYVPYHARHENNLNTEQVAKPKNEEITPDFFVEAEEVAYPETKNKHLRDKITAHRSENNILSTASKDLEEKSPNYFNEAELSAKKLKA